MGSEERENDSVEYEAEPDNDFNDEQDSITIEKAIKIIQQQREQSNGLIEQLLQENAKLKLRQSTKGQPRDPRKEKLRATNLNDTQSVDLTAIEPNDTNDKVNFH